MKQNDSKILTSKKSESAKLKEISKVSGKHINTNVGIDTDLLTQALKIKVQIDSIESTLKQLEKELKPLRDELVEQANALRTSKYDSVEFVNDGKRLYVYPKDTKSGKYDENKLEKLARERKLYSKIFEPTVKVNETELIKALMEEKITPDEFRAITLQVITEVAEMKIVSEQSNTVTEDNIIDINAG